MLSFSSSQRYFLYQGGVDMRKSFNGLSGLVRQYMGRELLSGDVFVFINKGKDKIKLLVWDRTGFAIYYKQLEKGTFELPSGQSGIELSWTDLVMLLEGIELKSIRRRKRFSKA